MTYDVKTVQGFDKLPLRSVIIIGGVGFETLPLRAKGGILITLRDGQKNETKLRIIPMAKLPYPRRIT